MWNLTKLVFKFGSLCKVERKEYEASEYKKTKTILMTFSKELNSRGKSDT